MGVMGESRNNPFLFLMIFILGFLNLCVMLDRPMVCFEWSYGKGLFFPLLLLSINPAPH